MKSYDIRVDGEPYESIHPVTLGEMLKDSRIVIISGEGTEGIQETYEGKLTLLAIKRRLTREECKGDRWAYCAMSYLTN